MTVEPLLSWSLMLVRPDGSSETVEARAEPPVWGAVLPGCWSSLVYVSGLFPEPFPIFGATPIQALQLGLTLINGELGRLAARYTLIDTTSGETLSPDMLTAVAPPS